MIALTDPAWGALAVIGGTIVTGIFSTIGVLIARSRAVGEKADTATERSIEAKTLADHVSGRVDKVAREEGSLDRIQQALDKLTADFVTNVALDAETKQRLVAEINRATAEVTRCEEERDADREERVADRERILTLEREVAQNKAVLHRIAPGLIQRPTEGG